MGVDCGVSVAALGAKGCQKNSLRVIVTIDIGFSYGKSHHITWRRCDDGVFHCVGSAIVLVCGLSCFRGGVDVSCDSAFHFPFCSSGAHGLEEPCHIDR